MAVKGLESRRRFLVQSTAIGTCFFAAESALCGSVPGRGAKQEKAGKESDEKEGEVTATEDLMREHGVLRRALLIYTAVSARLRKNAASIPPQALEKTARLFRTFGEDYHEKKLEEPHIFPAVSRAGGPAAVYPGILTAQHQRGREITDYILALTRKGRIRAAGAENLGRVLDELVLMYRNHAAREDTIVFPAWKRTLTARQLDEMGDKFEEIEQQMFGRDGFEDAVKQIADIEASLGLKDLAQFTAPPPPQE